MYPFADRATRRDVPVRRARSLLGARLLVAPLVASLLAPALAPAPVAAADPTTTTTVTSSSPSAVFATNVVFTVTVASAAGAPAATGNAIVYDGGAFVGSCTLTLSATCQVTSNGLAVGSHGITASYPGDIAHNGSTSDVLVQSIVMGVRSTSVAATTASTGATSLAVPAPTGVSVGDVMVAALTVTGGTGITITAPTGWTRIGTDVTSTTLLRQALFWKARATGETATSYTFTFGVAQKASASIVAVPGAVAATPVAAGRANASSASVTTPPLSFTSATGIALAFGGSAIGTTLSSVSSGWTRLASIAASGGKAATQTTHGAARGDLVTTASVASATFTMAAAAVNIGHTVFLTQAPAVSYTGLVATATTSGYGQGVTYTARVAPATASGYVSFFADNTILLGSCLLVGGTCSVGPVSLPVGPHTVVASFPGSGAVLSSTSSPLAVTVARGSTNTTLVSSGSPVQHGSSVAFTISVAGGDGSAVPGEVSLLEGATSLGKCTLGTSIPATCTVTTAALSVGTHSLTASYPGDANRDGSVSSPISQVVVASTTRTTVVASPNPVGYGSPVTLTATVATSDGTATGSVAFTDDGVALSSCQLGVGAPAGSCSISVPTFPIGTHQVGASYAGDGDHAGSVATPTPLVVTRASSTLSISGTPNPATKGARVAIVVSISTGDGTPATGSVAISDGTSPLGSCSLGSLAPSSCQLALSTLAIGSRTISATYPGDGLHLGASASYVQAIDRAATTTRISSSPNPSALGASVTFSLSVTSGDGTTPAGRVSLSDGTTPIGVCDLISGACTVSTAALQGGARTITATYAGDATRASSSASLVQNVTKATATTGLGVSGLYTYGNTTTLTATVSGLAGTPPTGRVDFSDGTAWIGSCQLGTPSATSCVFASVLPAGARAITARYGGDANYNASASTTTSFTIARAATATALGVSGLGTYGSRVTLTASVSPANAEAQVSFSDGSAPLGSCLPNPTTGICSISITTLAAGPHLLGASYPGSGNYLPSASSTTSVSISAAQTTTGLTTSASVIGAGESVLLTVAIGPATATGDVTLFDGSASIGTCRLAGGTCTFSATGLGLGSHLLFAWYPGDGNHSASQSPASSVAVRQPTTTTVSSSGSPSVYGSAVIMSVAVSTSDGNPATGIVTILDGTTGVGSCQLAAGAPSTCAVPVTGIGAGDRTVVARFGGDAFHAPSNGTVAQSVLPAGSSLAISSSANPITFGDTVTFTVIATTADGSVATGSVALSDGTAVVGRCTLVSGRCTVATSTLAGGVRSIVATYDGDANHTGSTATIAQTVNLLPTTTAASASPTSIVYGSPVTITATVSPTRASGTVTFLEGATTYGTCTLGTSSPGTCAFTTSALPVGTRTVTARYGGDANYATSSTTVSVTVARGTSTVTLTSTPPETGFGGVIAFEVAVSPSAATGTISFSDGSVTIGSCTLNNGACGLLYGSLSVGTHTITARYAGNANLSGNVSNSVTQIVWPTETTTTIRSSANPSTLGGGTLTVSLAPTNAPGLVAISDGTTPLTTCTLVNGSCTISLASWTLGVHDVSATFMPTNSNFGASSATLSQEVSVGYRGVASANTGSTTVSTLAVAAPAGLLVGDVVVAAVTIASSTVTIAAPTGWTRLGTDAVATATPLRQAIFWRPVTAGTATTGATFTFSGAVKGSAVAIGVGGASTALPAASQYASNVNSTAAPQIYTPALTLSGSVRGIALIFGGMATGTGLTSVGSGYTVPTGGVTASSGGKASTQTTTLGAYGTPATLASVVSSQFTTSSNTGALSIGSTVFLPQGIAPLR